MIHYLLPENCFHNFSTYACKTYRPIIARVISFPFLENWYQLCLFPWIRYRSFTQRFIENNSDWPHELHLSLYYNYRVYTIRPCRLPQFLLFQSISDHFLCYYDCTKLEICRHCVFSLTTDTSNGIWVLPQADEEGFGSYRGHIKHDLVLPRTDEAGFESYHGHIKQGFILATDISSWFQS